MYGLIKSRFWMVDSDVCFRCGGLCAILPGGGEGVDFLEDFVEVSLVDCEVIWYLGTIGFDSRWIVSHYSMRPSGKAFEGFDFVWLDPPFVMTLLLFLP